ncbi:DUF1360 domain-containing protein [Streptomyces sp. NPDC046374]|uniref:DUF1360 domain-containing protein n=1 Tax=Streptomyces sp. NPDC046374 TaxID=3154917 RepID=UPI0033EB9B07
MAALLLTYALALGAVLRLSRLVVDDDITKPLRNRLHARVHKPGGGVRRISAFVSELVACTWCTSIWVSAGVVAGAYLAGDSAWFRLPAAALTLSWLTGIIASWLDSPPPVKHLVHHVPDTASVRVVSTLADVPGQTTTG